MARLNENMDRKLSVARAPKENRIPSVWTYVMRTLNKPRLSPSAAGVRKTATQTISAICAPVMRMTRNAVVALLVQGTQTNAPERVKPLP